MPSPVTGLHHVTAIAGPAQRHVDFTAGTLGLRLVKQTVNFDDPGTYHLYYADAEARPGSVWTTFPWSSGRAGRVGAGQPTATAYAVPPGAVDRWMEALAEAGYDGFDAPVERFGERVLTVRDPDGLVLEFVEADGVDGQWTASGVGADRAPGAFHSVTLLSGDAVATARVLADVFGYEEHGQEGGRLRLVNPAADRARFVDLDLRDAGPSGRRDQAGRMGVGTVHHVAFRVPTDEAQGEVADRLREVGLTPTDVRDRQYFRSIYVREPGGVLFEVATDGPGFAVDEPADALGRSLKLPPQYEPRRERIEAALDPLRLPQTVR
jgi:glyoxalase family protein